ncbi:MAG: glutamate racemase [Candidatus Cyclobacteriaceae bacterium M3_2C_046]
MSKLASSPIGIFDSGIGGMTVAYAIKQLLPGESMIYFGDTAHLPYGDKSTAAIQAYAIKITDLLLKSQTKLILIACNSASAAAYDLVKAYVGSKAKVFNVIDPVVDHIREEFSGQKVGLIGTKQTVNSNVYKQKIEQLNEDIELVSVATPLLAPMIEEGFIENRVSQQVIHEYLKNPLLKDIQALILGCTHYPLIKSQINDYYQDQVRVIDSAEIVARSLKAFLEYNNLLNKEDQPEYRFMVSDYTRSFEESTRIFFREKVQLDKYPLWE